MRRVHRMPFGAAWDGGVARFRLWAPAASRVDVVVGEGAERRALPLTGEDGGWFARSVADVDPGERYAFRIDGDRTVPDPASRSNPDGVHAPSAVVDPAAHAWRDADWTGRRWEEAVCYELHVGTFSPEGTFAGAAARLDGLAALGITAIELMPVAAFPGRRNWGYDGVLPFAPAAAYGPPEALKRLVDDAHARGIMVLLDVVYNHFGPEGNYLHAYAPPFFTARHQTPWGAAINFDGAGSATVRDFFVHNALYWLHEFHVDGLRLDAVHAIVDDSPRPFVTELAERVREHVGHARHVHLVLEDDRNRASALARDGHGRPRVATAQWNDDFHHAAHVLATGEADGYYADYAGDPKRAFARALAEGFVFQGEASAFRGGVPRGERSDALPPVAFVPFLQNHDQVGNRAVGERLDAIAGEDAVLALTACLLLAPQVPLLFMGEEFAASTPFLFFCDFGPELAASVTRGRREEFARFAQFRDADDRMSIPDPNAASTFEASRLDWRSADAPAGRRRREHVRRLLDLRREHVLPLLATLERGGTREITAGSLVHVAWSSSEGARLHLVAELGGAPVADATLPAGVAIHATAGMPAPGGRGSVPAWGFSAIVAR